MHEHITYGDIQMQQRTNSDKGCKDDMVRKTKANTNQVA